MSLIRSQSRDLLACSFNSPNSIYIIAVNEDALERLHWIAFDFGPFLSVWLHTMQALLVFHIGESKGATTVMLEAADAATRIRTLQFDERIGVMGTCRLSGNEQTERVLIYDGETQFLLEFELSEMELFC